MVHVLLLWKLLCFKKLNAHTSTYVSNAKYFVCGKYFTNFQSKVRPTGPNKKRMKTLTMVSIFPKLFYIIVCRGAVG